MANYWKEYFKTELGKNYTKQFIEKYEMKQK